MQDETTPAAVPSPWRTVWFSPRLTIRRILEAEAPPSWISVVALAVLHQIFASLQVDQIDGTFSLNRSVMPVILGALQLVFGVFVAPFLLAFAGGWLGGEADASDIRVAVVWSYVPYAVAGLVWIPVLIAYGGVPQPQPDLPWGLVLTGLVAFAAAVWTFVLQVIMLAEVQRFAIWRAIASIVILLVPLLLLAAIR